MISLALCLALVIQDALPFGATAWQDELTAQGIFYDEIFSNEIVFSDFGEYDLVIVDTPPVMAVAELSRSRVPSPCLVNASRYFRYFSGTSGMVPRPCFRM